MENAIEVVKNYLKEFASEADRVLDEFFNKERDRSEQLDPIVSEFLTRYRRLLQGGKKVRGGLTVLGFEMFGGERCEDIIKAGAFVEMTHASILIHDDIHDRDDLRRGMPSLHKQFETYFHEQDYRGDAEHYGIAMGDTIGLLGTFLKYQLLFDTGFSSDRLVSALRVMSEYLVNTDYGQAMDLTYERLPEIDEADVMRVHKNKTADYTITSPLSVGAMLAGTDEAAVLDSIRHYGTPVGIAFQIRDDIIGLYGEQDVIGKPVGSDIQEGKNTLLYTEAKKRADTEQIDILEKWYGNPNLTDEGIRAVRAVIEDTGSLKYSEDLGWKYVEEGKEYIGQITADDTYAGMLADMADFMMAREK